MEEQCQKENAMIFHKQPLVTLTEIKIGVKSGKGRPQTVS